LLAVVSHAHVKSPWRIEKEMIRPGKPAGGTGA